MFFILVIYLTTLGFSCNTQDLACRIFPCGVWAFPYLWLECNPEIPVAPGVEHYVLDTSLDEVYFALQ